MSFSFSELHPSLARATQDMGFTKPTPVQSGAIPAGLEGRDILACAMTGSGKTAAFLIPIIERLLALTSKRRETRALVLSPTRELAAQTVDHFNELTKHTQLRAAAVYGGVGMRPQEQAFRRGVEVIVACPGRLLDHFRNPYARLGKLEVLVLDEADRMLDMGFLPDIKRILEHLPPLQQRLLFSATMPGPIAELSGKLLENPFRLDVERPAAPATKVEQSVFTVSHPKKPALLLALLERNEIGNALVFTRTKHRADRLASALTKQGVSCDCIHGNRSQSQRTRALDGFRSGRTRVLVATDIAARGIDVEALSHVVNFDIPHMVEDYIHRVGRTARAEASGQAFTFVSSHEHASLRAIEGAVGRLPRRELEGFDENAPIAGLWTPVSPGQQQQSQGGRGPKRNAQPSHGRAPSSDASPGRGGRGQASRTTGQRPAGRPGNRPSGPGRDNPRHPRSQQPRSEGSRSFEDRGRNDQRQGERRDSQGHGSQGYSDRGQRTQSRDGYGRKEYSANQQDRSQRGNSQHGRTPHQGQQANRRDDYRGEGRGHRRDDQGHQHRAGRPQRDQQASNHGERGRDNRYAAGDRPSQNRGSQGHPDDRRQAGNGAPSGRPNHGRANQGRPGQGRPNQGRPGQGRPHQDRPSQHPRGRRPAGESARPQGPGHRGSDRRNNASQHTQARRGGPTRGADGSLIGQPRSENSEVEVFRAGQPQTSAFAQFERQGGKAPRKRRNAGSRSRS